MTSTQNAKINVPNEEMLTSWKKMVNEQMERLQSFYKEMERHEKQGMEQANAAVDEMARLMKDSLQAASQLTTAWRQVAMEATQRAGEMIDKSLRS